MASILVIAECGINHGGNTRIAKEMIRLAKICYADIAKFQLSDVDTLFPDKQIIAQGRNWYDEVKKAQLSKGQVFELADYCRRLGIEFMASACDIERIGWLEEVGVKRYKVSTQMNQDKVLIEAMLKTKKQVLISHGEGYHFPGSVKYWNKYTSLYCVPKYPTPLSELQLQYVDFTHDYTGFSDHTTGIEASMIAMARGARIIEKHFCLKRDNSNPDMVCSIEPSELKQLVQFARKVEEIL